MLSSGLSGKLHTTQRSAGNAAEPSYTDELIAEL